MRLHHVSIPVRPGQLDAGRAFYSGVFGLNEIEPPETLGRARVAWFEMEDRELHLFIEPDANGTSSERHLAFAVEDLDATRSQLADNGVGIEDAEPIHNRPRFFCHDPFGNRLEVTQIVGPYR